MGFQRGQAASRLTTISVAASAHSVSSTACPRFEVVSTEYQEQASATRIIGSTTRALQRPSALPVMHAASRRVNAHCATKHSSAIVATLRPTSTLASG